MDRPPATRGSHRRLPSIEHDNWDDDNADNNNDDDHNAVKKQVTKERRRRRQSPETLSSAGHVSSR